MKPSEATYKYRLLPASNKYITNKRLLKYFGLPTTTKIIPGTLIAYCYYEYNNLSVVHKEFTGLFKGTYIRDLTLGDDRHRQISFMFFDLDLQALNEKIFHVSHFSDDSSDALFNKHDVVKVEILNNTFDRKTK